MRELLCVVWYWRIAAGSERLVGRVGIPVESRGGTGEEWRCAVVVDGREMWLGIAGTDDDVIPEDDGGRPGVRCTDELRVSARLRALETRCCCVEWWW